MGQFPALSAWPALPQPAPGSFHAGHDVIPCGVQSWAGGKAPSTRVEPHCGPKRQLGQESLSPLQRGRAQTPDSSSARATVRRRNGASSGWREHLVTSPPFRCSFLPETAKGLSSDLALSWVCTATKQGSPPQGVVGGARSPSDQLSALSSSILSTAAVIRPWVKRLGGRWGQTGGGGS
ncbi:unnamed protein product [Gulo gulo]|uniref:Uncharacterized protein n=1 Tax=Gulo gulo TaxID=48420 RepID=A0A9X9M066_GULGU|nr:unnamed protein product [Gulo gulo]